MSFAQYRDTQLGVLFRAQHDGTRSVPWCGVEKPAFPPGKQQVPRLRSALHETEVGTALGMTEGTRGRSLQSSAIPWEVQ
jgi:hypothetical protein